MPILATVGNHFSRFLHHLVFSFPTPGNNTTLSSSTDDDGAVNLDSAFTEPGEPKAFAGGIGPLSFAGSGYGVMLVLMALLLNRIHHVVRRPRLPAPPQPHPPVNSIYWRARIRLNRILTSYDTPRYLRLPGVICLLRAWMLFSVLTLQVANLWPVEPRSGFYGNLVDRVGQWAGDMEMQRVCWQVFLSVCAGLVCSGLANGLDRGRRRDVGQGFNLFGYSFLLHLYSSPLTHHRPPPTATKGRPDVHALFQLWLSLTELTWLQVIELSGELRKNQLLPTAVCGSLGLVHFVYALSTSPLKFPSFTFLTHLMALFLSAIITFSIVLKAFTHIFTIGYIPSPILANLLPHEGVVPSIEDDFGVMLLKVGGACLEATQYSGLRNELVGIEERHGPWLEIGAADSVVKRSKSGGFANEISDIEVSEPIDVAMETPYWTSFKAFWKAFFRCAFLFAFSLVLRTPGGRQGLHLAKKAYRGRWWYGPRQWRFWRREAWAAPAAFRADILRRIQERADQLARERAPVARTTAIDVPYGQYLRGEAHIEDDEEDWVDEDADSTSSGSASDAEEDQTLYRDLLAEQAEVGLQPVLLAHLTSASASPLTRRRYQALTTPRTPSPAPAVMSEIVQDRRASAAQSSRDEWDEDRRRSCVVCTIEPRDTIFWPCRCLAVCNECRESLASRLPAKEHMCPCCRRKVDGYSRIYIP